MSRAALLPHPADPFLLSYFLHFYNTIWRDEVDRLYIYVNSPMEKEVIQAMYSLVEEDPKIKWLHNMNQIEHGAAINNMLDVVQEDYIMLIEDDGFIFKKTYVDRYFASLERGDYDIIGSPRASCGFEILKEAQLKWDIPYTGLGDRGPNFWPCFFFTKRDLLLKTDRNFGARRWVSGERIEGLDYIAKEDQHGDTFVNTSLQLRGMVPKDRICMIPQYHGHPDDVKHYEDHEFIFDGQAYCTHVGSLSSGTHGILIDSEGRSLARRGIDPPKGTDKLPEYCTTDFERREFERRVSFWLMAWEHGESIGLTKKIPEFAELYREALDRIIKQYNLSYPQIRNRMRIYKTLGL